MRYLGVLSISALLLLSAADTDFAGRYSGVWKSDASGGGGVIQMTLTAVPDATWKCDVSFTLGGEDIKTKVQSCKLENSQFDVAYDFDAQGVTARSKVSGKWDGKAFAGTYQTTLVSSGDGVDSGTWNASRSK
jgi:hypothetical protein